MSPSTRWRRIVKQTFRTGRRAAFVGIFPVYAAEPEIRIITKKPVTASQSELDENPRSRSAKLRVAEKL